MRKFLMLFVAAVVCTGSAFAQENPYDDRMGAAIAASDWFAAREYYERSSDSLSDYMRLFSGALIDHNSNHPEGAVEKIQRMYEQYNAQMGANVFSLFWLMSDNLAELGRCDAARDICTNLLAQGRNYMDEATRTAYETGAVLFALRAGAPPMAVANPAADHTVPFEIRDEYMQFAAVCQGQTADAILDTGAQMTVIDRHLATKLGLELTPDSIAFNEVRCPLALLDTLRLGPAVFVHVPCAVLPHRSAGVTDCDIVLGNDLLRLFPEVEVDYTGRMLRLKSHAANRPDTPRNLMFDKVPYVRVWLEAIPAVMIWDTGATKSSVEPGFCDRHGDRLPPFEARGRRQAKTLTGNNPTLDYAVLPQVRLQIAGREAILRDAYVIVGMPHADLLGVPFDATLGALPPQEFERLILNFQQMYFLAE